MPRPLPRCHHCDWTLYPILLADHTVLWHDNVHDEIRCLVNPDGVHVPSATLVTWVSDTAVSGR